MGGLGKAPLGGQRVGLGQQRACCAGFGLTDNFFIGRPLFAAKTNLIDPLREGRDEMIEDEKQQQDRADL